MNELPYQHMINWLLPTGAAAFVWLFALAMFLGPSVISWLRGDEEERS